METIYCYYRDLNLSYLSTCFHSLRIQCVCDTILYLFKPLRYSLVQSGQWTYTSLSSTTYAFTRCMAKKKKKMMVFNSQFLPENRKQKLVIYLNQSAEMIIVCIIILKNVDSNRNPKRGFSTTLLYKILRIIIPFD